MTAYLLSRIGVEALETIVFAAGPDDQEESVAAFTDPAAAEAYLNAAGWADQYAVAAVESIPFLKWLLQAHEEGVRYLAVDPKFSEQQAGRQLDALSIEDQLAHAGQHIVDVAGPDF